MGTEGQGRIDWRFVVGLLGIVAFEAAYVYQLARIFLQ
jgi:hypothetical protein